MTTATANYSANFVNTAPVRKAAQRAPRLSLAGWLAVMSSALDMAAVVPNSGRVSAKQLAKVRAIAESI
jgi:hypothetical protein